MIKKIPIRSYISPLRALYSFRAQIVLVNDLLRNYLRKVNYEKQIHKKPL